MGFVMSMEELMARSGRTSVFLDVEYAFAAWLTKPEIVERLLPPPLEPVDLPLAWCMLANYRETNFSPPYQETALCLAARHNHSQASYCISMPINDGQGMSAGREFFGIPKKLARIEFSSNNGKIRGATERLGHRFFEIELDLEAPPQSDRLKDLNPWEAQTGDAPGQPLHMFNYKAFRSPDWTGFDYPPRLIKHALFGKHKIIKFCKANINITESPYDPWSEVEIVETLGAVYTRGEVSMGPGEVAAEVDPMQYLPYYMSKFDFYD
jgi:acetoacetate decarboxylase